MQTMASSSHTYHYQTLKNTKEHIFVEEKKVDQEEDEWLKLGLGLGSRKKIVDHHVSNSDQFSPASSQTVKPQIGLGFEGGLSFELKGKEESRGHHDVVKIMDHQHGNSLLRWPSSDHCYHDHHFHHNDDNGMVVWPSSSSCQSDPLQEAPCDSHHYSCARNPHQSGLWFTLLSSTNRSGEALPQIPKAYIRVMDESMTVFMVKKYLVRKLGLSSEAEIDLSCMGESLSHIQTLKQVRDSIWLPRLVESVNSMSSTLSHGESFSHGMSINHLMSIMYRKHCIFN